MLISFKQFLTEIKHLANDIHNNTTISTVKRIAKNAKYHAARFVIDHSGKLHAGDGGNHLHTEIHPSHDHHITGMVHYNKDKETYHHVVYDVLNKDPDQNDSFNPPQQAKIARQHPVIKQMKQAGVPKGKGKILE